MSFLDHAKLSTTSRYLTIDSRGMHAAMENAEKTRRRVARERKRGNPVANTTESGEHQKSDAATKSVQ